VQRAAKVSAIDEKGKTLFERLYLVAGLRTTSLFVTMPSAENPNLLLCNLFLDFCAMSGPSIFFVSMIRQVIWQSPLRQKSSWTNLD